MEFHTDGGVGVGGGVTDGVFPQIKTGLKIVGIGAFAYRH